MYFRDAVNGKLKKRDTLAVSLFLFGDGEHNPASTDSARYVFMHTFKLLGMKMKQFNLQFIFYNSAMQHLITKIWVHYLAFCA